MKKAWQQDAILILAGILGLVAALSLAFSRGLNETATNGAEVTRVTQSLSAPTPRPTVAVARREGFIRFAAIGDYGYSRLRTQQVASMVKGWEPDFIITMGDNNYDDGEARTIDRHVGLFYSQYIFPYQGFFQGGTAENRFFPALGNHDWHAEDAQPYLDYFPIDESPVNTGSSGNERYYDFVQGSVHFFVVDSDRREPHGNTLDSIQATWLKIQMTQSTAPWKIVYFHHAPYSSGEKHGSTFGMRWPFAEWGADAVLAAHDHVYERVERDGIVYFVNGLGGRGPHKFGKNPVRGSQIQFTGRSGAMLIEASETELDFAFYSVARGGTLIDSYRLSKSEVEKNPTSGVSN